MTLYPTQERNITIAGTQLDYLANEINVVAQEPSAIPETITEYLHHIAQFVQQIRALLPTQAQTDEEEEYLP